MRIEKGKDNMSNTAQTLVPKSELTQSVGNPKSGAVCIPNISTAERRKRLAFGAMTFAVSLVILAALVASGASRWWRLPLFFLFMGATSGFFQWRDKTCVGLTAKQSRKLGDHMEQIEN